ncbi:DUF4012 domain-containing protein [Microbacterium terricola]|uniref:Chemotaxis protein n=1 Tax=Microbacterium terricola TaxID=344163 RepID=A0ABM8DYL2_9MICO|nr:DUF4012 domain-containing protein [Microbacterium terricola]UYK38638.1 DUF4012 domain-containing protein [Microbacterium terricola]BDV30675.1 chemotaxis protein [Microbacterium terricola]
MSTGVGRRTASGIRTIVLICAALLIALLAAFAWAGSRAWVAQQALGDLPATAAEASDAVGAGDVVRLRAVADELGAASDDAAQAVTDPTWGVLEAIPVLGANFTAVRTVAVELDELSRNAVSPLVGLLGDAEVSAPDGDLVDIALLETARPVAEQAAATLDDSAAALGAIDTSVLLTPVAGGVERVREVVTTASPTAHELSAVASVLPGLLGADGERTILVLLQNNAELRSGGGVTGSFVLLKAVDGRVEIVDQADSSNFPRTRSPIAEVPAAAVALFGDDVGRYVQNVSMVSDYAVTARLASAWWATRTGTAPDAVLSLDPLVVRALLKATGPVDLADGTPMTEDNVVHRLLVEPYLTMDGRAQTAFQRTATRALFEQLLARGVEPLVWGRALAASVADGRVALWSADPADEDELAGTALGGPLARHRLAGDDAFAVYLNDATGAKMDSYLKVALSAGAATCREDGRSDAMITVTLTSTAPADAAGLPEIMNGGGRYGVEAGVIATDIAVAAPPGSFFGGVRTEGEPALSADVDDDGVPTSLVRVEVSPGETKATTFRFTTAEPGSIEPTLLHTPLISTPEVQTGVEVACG